MKNIVFLLISSLFSFSLLAQSYNFEWATVINGPSSQVGFAISSDQNGNVYSTGTFAGTSDFDPGIGLLNLSSNTTDIYLQKLNHMGNLQWVHQFGDTSYNSPTAIALDANQNCYLSGSAGNADLDPSSGVSLSNSTSNFLLKLDSSGAFQWAINLDRSSIFRISTYANNIYVVGTFNGSVDFNPGSGNFIMNGGAASMFILKLNSQGNFIWAKKITSSASLLNPLNMSIDLNENPIITGYFRGTVDFDPNSATQNLTSNGIEDIFTMKLDPLGNLVWAINMGGTNEEYGFGVCSDDQGNVYTAGRFSSTADFDPSSGVFNLTKTGTDWDGFVQKVDQSGNFLWVKQFRGNNLDYCQDIKYTDNELIILTIFSDTLDTDPSANNFNLISNGRNDISLTSLDTSGNFNWANSIGSIAYDRGLAIDIDSRGNILTTGAFQGLIDFNPGTGTSYVNSSGVEDAFVQKLSYSTVGIQSSFIQAGSRIQPNPTRGQLQIKLSSTINDLGIRVYTIEGKEVQNFQFQQVDQIQFEIEGESGVYLIELRSEKGIETLKVIKE